MPTQIQPTVWTASPQQVERVIGAALPHVAADGTLPMLACVRLEIADDRLIAVATDRYTLGVAWADLKDWNEDTPPAEPISVSIYATDLRRLFAFLRPNRKLPATWTLTASGLTVAIREESLTVAVQTFEYVSWRAIVGQIRSKTDDSTGVPVMRFTPRMVNHFMQSAKALGEDFGQMYWHFGAKSTDAPMIRLGENFVGLLMPQRLPDAPTQLDLSAIGIEAPEAVAAA